MSLRSLAFRLPDSILSRTLMLIVATVLLLTAVNVAIIVLIPPPRTPPIDTYEIARLLQGRPIAKRGPVIEVSHAGQLPAVLRAADPADLVSRSVAETLNLDPGLVRVVREPRLRYGTFDPEGQMQREFRLYATEGRFNPPVFGSFTVGARLQPGRWTILSVSVPDPVVSWQIRTIMRLLLSLAAVLPIAWWFSRRLASPIRAFGDAADRLGHRRRAAPVEVEGPVEIRQAAAAINEMQVRLQRHVGERTSMIAAIAHDLRTPLSRLNFHLATAPDELRGKAEAEILEMEQLIAATLEFVRSEERPRVLDQIDLSLLVEGVVDDFADSGQPVELAATVPATVSGDPLLLKRLFTNLVANAVAYGRKAQVTVEARDGTAVVDIADEGPGLSVADMQRAFEPFYRAETSRNRATGGMGLGLAIVKSAVEAHGGQVRLVNRPEGGLLARVSLPFSEGEGRR